MPHSLAGTNLEVDLTLRSIKKVKTDPESVRDYLGGKGLGTKMLWDRVPPETTPFSPDNLIIINTGLLVGTSVPFANRALFTFISPATDFYRHSSLGGFWAPELKHAGYDSIVISGKSPTPVYLWINDDQVEIRDASQLWGKSVYETRAILIDKLENEKIQIAGIGQAGENKVYAASVQGGAGASASRGGLGALWGDKKLKAIAVYGTKDISVANPARLTEMSNYIMERSQRITESKNKSPDPVYRGTWLHGINRWETRDTWYGNFNETDYGQLPLDSELKEQVDKIDEKLGDLLARKGTRGMSCYNCRVHCRYAFTRPDGSLTFLKCISLHSFLVYAKHFDYDWALDCYYKCEDWGLDIAAFPRYIALAIDLYERGILTKEDTDGMHLEFGNPEIFTTLMEKTVHREGIGDVLANGTLKAARQISKGAEGRVNVEKGLELNLAAPMHYTPLEALGLSVADKQFTGGQIGVDSISRAKRPWSTNYAGNRQEKEDYIKQGWFPYPEEYQKYWLSGESWEDGNDYEAFCQLLAYDNERFALTDSLGVCHFTSGFGRYLPINSRTQLAELISKATGMDISEDELTTTANRIINLIKAYNLRQGLRREDDTPPQIFFKRDPAPPRKKIDPILFNKWLDRFYELRGWNKEGVPTRETLEKYGLDYVEQDLEERGILTEKEVLTA